MYYYGEVTMKEIGNEIGVNESRVSQLHARAVQRLRKTLGPDLKPGAVAAAMSHLGKAVAQPKVMGRKRMPIRMETSDLAGHSRQTVTARSAGQVVNRVAC